MCRPRSIKMQHKPQGFALFVVLVMMIVIAFLVVAAVQSYNTEMRISSNDSDRKMAMQLAESALRQGEAQIALDKATVEDIDNYSETCVNGLCLAAESEKSTNKTPAWQRSICGSGNTQSCLEVNGVEVASANNEKIQKNPRYIIELMQDAATEKIFRVTARAWGVNNNTVVTVQSYVDAE